jgi:very-short-patch-repair endonuclease
VGSADVNTDKSRIFLYYWLALAPDTCPQPESEYPFTKVIGRKHRFDWAFPKQKIAIEVEGNAWNVKGGGRHMQDHDLEKYNLAAEMGWRIFRYSPAMLKNHPDKCVEQVVKTLTEKSPSVII